MAGYTRQSVADIINGANITAPPLNAEFNQILAAFNSSTGHSHDGSTGNAPKIPLTTSVSGYLPVVHGGVGGRNNTTATSDPTTTNDNTEGYAPGSIWINATTGYSHLCLYNTTNAANWVTIAAISNTNIIAPKATNTVDLGTGTLQFKDLYVDGIGYIDDINAETMSSTGNVDVGGNLTVSGAVTFTTSASIGGATTLESLGVTNNFTVGGTAGITGNVTMSGDVTIHGSTILGNAATDTVEFKADVSSDLIPSTDDTHSLGAVDNEWKDLFIDGVANIDSLVADTADIDGGTLDGVDIGAGTASTANFTGLTVSSTASFTGVTTDDLGTVTTADIDGGSIDGVTIGTNSVVTDLKVDNIQIDGNAITSTNDNGDIDITPNGTGEVNISKVDIDAGAIDNTTIGGTTAAAGSFTTVTTSGQATLATAVISGGSVDDTPIGSTTASTGAFTTVTASSGITGALTGNVAGNVTGDIYSEDGLVKILDNGSDGTDATFTGAVTGNVTGNISASSGTSTFENVTVNGTIDFTQAVLSDVADPTNAQDAATKNYVDTELSALVDSSPDTLNTLNELAAALGDDADFSTTVTNSIAEKLPLAGGTMTGAIAMGDNKVTGVTDPTDTQDASTKAYTDTQRDTRLALAGGTMTGNITLGTNKITTTADPTNADDLARKGYVDAIHGSAVAAATSATNASNSKTAAANSATAALASQNAALASQNAAAASYDSFDDRYLGAKSSAPTVDNDGDALVIGALYFDTTAQIMKVYGSSGWQSAGSAVNGTSERYKYTATANQNTFSGNDDNGNALGYDAGFLDVFLSGIRLVNGTDFTATSGTSIQLASNAAVGDILEIVTYGTFVLSNQSLSDMTDVNTGGVSTNDVLAYNGTNFVPTSSPTVTGLTTTGNINLGDNDKLVFGANTDLEIFYNGATNVIKSTTSSIELKVNGGGNFKVGDEFGNFLFAVNDNSNVELYHGTSPSLKFETTATGVTVTGEVVASSLDISGDVDIDGTTNLDAVDIDGAVDMASTLSVNEIDLKAIAESKSNTAVDIFVYDTSKDSDGGAWRHRTQHTSWYNESLNTSTRGATKKFPSVAVIVAEPYKMIIYDGDDPDLPMWMVFNGQSAGGYLGYGIGGGRSLSSVLALNGSIHTGGLVGNWATTINFITELGTGVGVGSTVTSHTQIVNRNTASDLTTVSTTKKIVNGVINDLAITVLPNAPIDADTGLPVSTIAVATDGGVSVIKDDGTVDSTISTAVNKITVMNGYWMAFCQGVLTTQLKIGEDLPAGSSGSHLNGLWNNNAWYYGGSMPNTRPPLPTRAHSMAQGYPAFGSNTGEKGISLLTGLSDVGESACHITDSFNTGWMPGDIKLATLSDTDDTNISASGNTNILSGGWTNNGNFPYETFTTSGLDITSAINTTAYGAANKTWNSVAGKTYTAYFNLTLNSGTAPTLFVQTSSSFGNGRSFQTVNGVNSFTFTATMSGSTYFSFSVNTGVATNFSVANLELYEGGVADRSVNGTGLSVFGTVTKTAVATGADLVGYSGFSSSNYLQQPHQDYMDDVSGNWCVSHWGKTAGTSTQSFWEISQLNNDNFGSGSVLALIVSGNLRFYIRGNTGSQDWQNTDGFSISDDVWHLYHYIKSGDILFVYQDGVLKATKSLLAGRSYNEDTSVLRIGKRSDGSSSPLTSGSMALWRFSATIPSSEQIAKIYNDEKHLFSENAKATLYGSSDAVEALAYDDTTKLLHAGTSAGRSVFQGLRRVDNTTDAVGSAISASNGLVAED